MPVAFLIRFGNGRAMRRLVHHALILCLVLTGIGLGAARGTVLRAERVVLCTGHGVVVVERPDGQRQAHLCPDMALSLLAATLDHPGDALALHTAPRSGRAFSVLHTAGRKAPSAAARDPPAGQVFATKPV